MRSLIPLGALDIFPPFFKIPQVASNYLRVWYSLALGCQLSEDSGCSTLSRTECLYCWLQKSLSKYFSKVDDWRVWSTVSHNYSGEQPRTHYNNISEFFSIIDSFRLHINPTREVLLSLFCRHQTEAYLVRLIELSKVWQVTCGVEARI